MLRASKIAGSALAILTLVSVVGAADPLTIVTWGGAYEASQKAAYFKPFTEQTGIEIVTVQYNGGIEELVEQVASGQRDWDLIDLNIADNIEACNLGLLQTIDHDDLPESLDGLAANDDFLPGMLPPCGVGQIVSSTVLAYNDEAFAGKKPDSIADLFDSGKFPGKRGLQRRPIAILEWALLSYGVPVKDLYELLSTPRGLKLAFRRLDSIKSDIVWWDDGEEPVRLLEEGSVVMTSGYNGRFFNAAINHQLPVEIIWDGQLINYSTWGIPEGSTNADAAFEFIKFATDTRRLADQSKYIAYGPARQSSASLVRKHEASGIDVRPHLPTYLPHQSNAIMQDHLWYARTQTRIIRLFREWLAE